jgi:shikimate kinase
MGAGKTSVGEALAKKLGWQFIDLDEQIQAREGRTIAEIFQQSGEERFRDLESEALQVILRDLTAAPAVVALGGGAILRKANLEAAKRTSAIAFLDAPVEELRRRCLELGEARPLLGDEYQFRQLYESRRERYMEADVRIETGGKSVEQVAAEVAEWIKELDRKNAKGTRRRYRFPLREDEVRK